MVSDPSILRNPDPSPENPDSEINRLIQELTEKELELATLENELSAFESRYTRTVAVLFARLDLLDREIAKELLRLHPQEQYRQGFHRAEAKAQASEQAVNGKDQPENEQRYKPTEEIKNLFRKVAKTIHPDLSANDAERALRTELMARANVAYKRGDKQALEQILYEWEHRDEQPFYKEPKVQEGDHRKQTIARIQHRIQEIETRIEELKRSELYQLMRKVEQAEAQGQDLLAEMASDLRAKIQGAEELLDSLRQQAS